MEITLVKGLGAPSAGRKTSVPSYILPLIFSVYRMSFFYFFQVGENFRAPWIL